jgi:hypothetical protein
MKNIEKILFKNNIYVIYVGWSGVGTEGQFIFDSAYDIIKYDKKYKSHEINPYKSLKILYSEDMIYHLSKTGKINLIIDDFGYNSYFEKKDLKIKLKVIKDVFTELFHNNASVKKNSILIKI